MISDLQEAWGQPLQPFLCPHCDWRFLIANDGVDHRCPHCYQAVLTRLDPANAPFLDAAQPERVVPFTVDSEAVQQAVASFADGIPFAPPDLDAAKLRSRLQWVYLPHWLVDRDVSALWEAEVGFDYEVVSHQERYADGQGWRTREVTEDRIRWEPRVGRLERRYENVPVLAIEARELLQALGGYAFARAREYRPADTKDAAVRIPDRPPETAWTDAVPLVRTRGADECQRAAGADHVRRFRWSVTFGDDANWTLLLLPAVTTYYLDDEDAVHTVWVNGQSGRVHGTRRASMKRAWRATGIVAVVALVIFLVSLVLGGLGMVMPPLLVVAAIGAVLAFLVGMGALIPVVRAWSFNRKQRPEQQ